jgi:hypothetical protein
MKYDRKNETQIVRDFLPKLRRKIPEATIFKHNDYYTSGIPDFSVTVQDLTTWFEVKVFPNSPTKLQAFFLQRLKPRSYLITFDKHGLIATIDEVTYTFSQLIERVVDLSYRR